MCSFAPIIRNASRMTISFLENNSAAFSALSSRPLSSEAFTYKIPSKMCHPTLAHVYFSRSFAKKKGGKHITQIPVSDQELGEVFNVKKLYSDFDHAISAFKQELIERASIRTSPNAIEGINVQYEDGTHKLQELADIGKKGKCIMLDMSAFPGAIPAVLDALNKSAMGFNPKQEGNTIIIMIQKVTREHREVLVKGAKKLLNDCKEKVRSVQNHRIKQLENVSNLSEDDVFRLKSQLTTLGNKYITEAENMFKVKEKELLMSD